MVNKRFQEERDSQGDDVFLLGKKFKWPVLNDSGQQTDDILFMLEGTNIDQFDNFHLGTFFD